MSAGGISYSGLTTNPKVTLPSVDMWGTNMNILRNPLRSITTRRRDKVGDTQNILLEQDDSGDRIAENILVYARGVNPMVSVSYDNASNNSGGLRTRVNIDNRDGSVSTRSLVGQASLPYKVQNVRPPIFRQEDLLPLSRLPRVWCHADTNPKYPEFKDQKTCPETQKSIVTDEKMLHAPPVQTACFSNTVPTITDDLIHKALQDKKTIHESTLQGDIISNKAVCANTDMIFHHEPHKGIQTELLHTPTFSTKGSSQIGTFQSEIGTDIHQTRGTKNKQVYEAFTFLGDARERQWMGDRQGMIDLKRHIHDQLLWMEAMTNKINPNQSHHDAITHKSLVGIIEKNPLQKGEVTSGTFSTTTSQSSSLFHDTDTTHPSSGISDDKNPHVFAQSSLQAPYRKEERTTDTFTSFPLQSTPVIHVDSNPCDSSSFTNPITQNVSTHMVRESAFTHPHEIPKSLESYGSIGQGDAQQTRQSVHSNPMTSVLAQSQKTFLPGGDPYAHSHSTPSTKNIPRYEWSSPVHSPYSKDHDSSLSSTPSHAIHTHQIHGEPISTTPISSWSHQDDILNRQVQSHPMTDRRVSHQSFENRGASAKPLHDHWNLSSSDSSSSPVPGMPIVTPTSWTSVKQKAVNDYHARNLHIRA